MPLSQVHTHPDRELRGFRFRIYTTENQDLLLRDTEEKLRKCWNWLCSRSRDVDNARAAYAERYHGIVRPERPAETYSEGTTAEQIKTIWEEHKRQLQRWRQSVREACKGVDAVSYRTIRSWCEHFGVKHSYQLFPHACDVTGVPAHLLDALCTDYEYALSAASGKRKKAGKRSTRPPRVKRDGDHVTLRVRSGTCFRLRAAGPRPDGSGSQYVRWCNCQIHLPGIGWIAGRIGVEQLTRLESPEYWVEGVSIVEETDGWYAAIRQWVDPCKLTQQDPSPSSRWAGYGLPSSHIESDHGRSTRWIRVEHRGWGVEVKDCFPSGTYNPEFMKHRWVISLNRPDGQRINPRKGCQTREEAQAWGRRHVDQVLACETPGTQLRLSPVESPRCTGAAITVGTNCGLVNIITLSSEAGEVQTGNPRALHLLERISDRQVRDLPYGKELTRASRRTRHMLRGVLAWVAEAVPSEVRIEDGGSNQSAAQFLASESHGRDRKSGGYVPAAGWLVAQLKSRYTVREVECCGIIGTCSQCGKEGEISINRRTREALCAKCGHSVDQDLGAARNVRRKSTKSHRESQDDHQPQHGSA